MRFIVLCGSSENYLKRWTLIDGSSHAQERTVNGIFTVFRCYLLTP